MSTNRTGIIVLGAMTLFCIVTASVSGFGQDEFDIAVCNANVDKYARDKCLESLGASKPAEPEPKKPKPTQQAPKSSAPNANWKALAEKHLAEANTYCANRVERLAKYDFEWTDGWLELKFLRYLPSEKPGVIIYMGDKIKFQNGFGAWQPYIYLCEFNTKTNTVMDVSATPGRLP